MINWIKSKELFLFIFVAFTAKNILITPNFSDAIIFISVACLYAFKLYLKSKEEPPVNAQLKQEIAELKSSITALSIRPAATKSTSSGRMF